MLLVYCVYCQSNEYWTKFLTWLERVFEYLLIFYYLNHYWNRLLGKNIFYGYPKNIFESLYNFVCRFFSFICIKWNVKAYCINLFLLILLWVLCRWDHRFIFGIFQENENICVVIIMFVKNLIIHLIILSFWCYFFHSPHKHM